MISKMTRRLGVVGAAGVLALGAYAYTAANTVPASSAGSGSGAITGYTVSGITYTLNGTDPRNIDAVNFTISPAAAATVKAQLVSGGTWFTCVNTAGSVSCDTSATPPTAAAADSLTVVAAD